MPLFWKLLAGLGGLLLLIVVAVGITIRTFDANDLIGPIQQHIRDATGRELTIRGGAELKLALTPKLVINDVSLGNASWGQSPQMLTAKRVEAEVALLPLLRRRVDIVRFSLVEPTIALETDANGKGNWEIASQSGGAAGSAASGTARTLNGFAIGDLAINNGTISFRDGATGKVTNVAVDSLSLHARDPQSPISAQFRGTVDDIAVSLEGDLGPVEALVQKRWPYPVTLQGSVNGQKTSVSTQLRIDGKTTQLGELKVNRGPNTVTGQAAVTQGTPRNKMTFNLTTPSYSLADLPVDGAAARATAAVRGGADRFVFRDEPLPIALFTLLDAEGELNIGQLVLLDGRRIDNVHASIKLENGRLEIPALQASAFGGTTTGRIVLDATHQPSPELSLHLQAKGFELGALLAALGRKGDVRGGKTDMTVDIAASGKTPRQWASSMTGTATAIVGPATLANAHTALDSSLNRLGEAINPFHKSDASTELQCAVVRLPLRNGVAQVDRSIALETTKFGASASGALDFRDETLDLSIRPQVREGVPLAIPQIAELVRFHGAFTAPAVTIDSVAAAATIARIGAAAYSGGLSLVGESLLARTKGGGGGSPCQIALGHANSNAERPASSDKASPQGTDDVLKAIGRAFGR